MFCVSVAIYLHFIINVAAGAICTDGTSVGDDNFKKDTDHIDDVSGVMFLVTSSMYRFSCCGQVRQFKSFSTYDGDIYYLIWRPTGESGKYRLVGNIKALLSESPRASSILPSDNVQPEVSPGDVMGWYSPATSTVPYTSATTNGDTFIMAVDSIPEIGDVVDWSTAVVQKGRIYAIAGVVNGISGPPEFKNVQDSVQMKTTDGIGTDVYKVTVSERQFEDTVITLSESPFFAINNESSIIVASSLEAGSYDLTITATNLCGLSSSIPLKVTVTEKQVTDPTSSETTPDRTTATVLTSGSNTEGLTQKDTEQTTTDKDSSATKPVTTTTTTGNTMSNNKSLENSDDSDDGWKYGVGFSVAIVLLVAIGLAIFCLWKWKKRQHSTKPKEEPEKGETNETDDDAKDGDTGEERKDIVNAGNPEEVRV